MSLRYDVYIVTTTGTLRPYRDGAPIPADPGPITPPPTGGLGVQPLGTSPLGG